MYTNYNDKYNFLHILLNNLLFKRHNKLFFLSIKLSKILFFQCNQNIKIQKIIILI